MAGSIVEVEHLVKLFGDIAAVDDISFSVGEGEFFGFLGPNGAGKTTTINILATLLRPTSGHVRINGHDVQQEPDAVRASIGIIFQDASLDDRLTGMENLQFHARVYHLPRRVAADRSEQLLKMVDLWDRRDALVKTYSGGMRRRLEIARGLLHDPRLLFLDEPTLGLDPQTREHIWEYLHKLRAETGISLFLTTHYMEEAERCTRIAIIDHGKIVALDTPERLKASVGGDVITLTTDDNNLAAGAIKATFGVEPSRFDGSLRLEVRNGDAFIPRLVQGLSVPIKTVSLNRPSLDDVFIRLTGRAMREPEAGGAERTHGHARGHGR